MARFSFLLSLLCLLAGAVLADTGEVFAGCAQSGCAGQKERVVGTYYQKIVDTVKASPLSTSSFLSAKYIVPFCDTSTLEPGDESAIAVMTKCLSAYSASAAKVVILDLAKSQEPVLLGVKLPSPAIFAKWNFKRANFRPGMDVPFPKNQLDRLLPDPESAKVSVFPRRTLVSGMGAIEFPKYMQNNSDIVLLDQPLNDETVDEYIGNLYDTTFAFCASGKNLQARIFEALKYGNIPILLDHDIVLPFEEQLDWTQFAVFIPFSELAGLIEMLKGIPVAKQKAMHEVGSYVYGNHFASAETAGNTLARVLGGKSADIKKDFQDAVRRAGGDPNIKPVTFRRTRPQKSASQKKAEITKILSGKVGTKAAVAVAKEAVKPLPPLSEIPVSHKMPEHQPAPVVLEAIPEIEPENKFIEPESISTHEGQGAIDAFNPVQWFQIEVRTAHPLMLSTCNEQTGAALETDLAVYATAAGGKMVRVNGGRTNLDLTCDDEGHAKLLVHVTPESSPYYVSVVGDRSGEGTTQGEIGCVKREFQGSKRYKSW
jgi:hypothetical protein